MGISLTAPQVSALTLITLRHSTDPRSTNLCAATECAPHLVSQLQKHSPSSQPPRTTLSHLTYVPPSSAHGAHHRDRDSTRCPFSRPLQVCACLQSSFSFVHQLTGPFRANLNIRHARSSEKLSVKRLLCDMRSHSPCADYATVCRVTSMRWAGSSW